MIVEHNSQALSFADRFDAESLTIVIEHLGPEVGERIARDHPTLCDLITASLLLGRDPLDLFAEQRSPNAQTAR